MLDLAIIGGGPAGLAAGLYATRGGLKDVVMFEMGMPGGQITSSSEMENYPGVAAVTDGMSFMAPWQEQCFRFGLKHEMATEILLSISRAIKRVAHVPLSSLRALLRAARGSRARTSSSVAASVPARPATGFFTRAKRLPSSAAAIRR